MTLESSRQSKPDPQLISSFIDGLMTDEEARQAREAIAQNPESQKVLGILSEEDRFFLSAVPCIKLRKENEEILRREVLEIFKKSLRENSPSVEGKLARLFKSLKSFEKLLNGIIFSKEMVKYYMIAIVMGAILKIFS